MEASATQVQAFAASRISALHRRLEAMRGRTTSIIAGVTGEALDRVHDPLMSPLGWDVGHIAAYEDLWIAHRGAGLPLLRPDLAEVYDAFETPRDRRGDAPYLRHDEARGYLAAVRSRTRAMLDGIDPFFVELVIEHEAQHGETMLQTLQLSGLPGPSWAWPRATPAGVHVRIAGGEFTLGSGDDGFAYDNERPAHIARVGAFWIDTAPVTQRELGNWVQDGGYERREWWSDDGWAWRTTQGIDRPAYWTDGGGLRVFDEVVERRPEWPAQHLSFYEAEAYARGRGARLPTEAEWERAARAGVLEGIGGVWEWTASEFDGYPGFAAYPYREYSEVFFGRGYRILRGASVATAEAPRRVSFRNWDLPQRRQVFAGLRCAWDG